ncbi:dTDP-4-dehydrorhamnose 3,5-epimerase [beta proteobacterium MWH-UniP1]
MSSAVLNVTPLEPFKDVLLITNKVFGDARGFFVESFNAKTFAQSTGLNPIFVQDNHSRSSKGVLRGIHYQLAPHVQGKLVRVANGSAFDVAVDLRRSSPTFGKWVGHTLTATGGEMLWIPPGFGHGFVTLEDSTDFLYKTTDFYAPESEASVAWNDPTIGIEWPKEVLGTLQLSPKDQAAPTLKSAKLFD